MSFNATRMRAGTVAGVLIAASTLLGAQQQPTRVEFDNDRVRLLNRVDAAPVAGIPAGSVTADVVVGPDGRVESVIVTQGATAHRPPAVAALNQYRFAPVQIGGEPARVITTLSVYVPDALSAPALAKEAGADNSATVEASRDVALTADCSRAMMRQDGSAESVRACRAAVDAANQLPPGATRERRTAHGYLGNVYMFARRWREAIAEYQLALSLDPQSEAGHFRAGEYLGMIAAARVSLGELSAADLAAESAVTRVRASIAADPDNRELQTRTLSSLLLLRARIKRLRGNEAEARTFERQAEALTRSK